ncbi:MAG TPA: hypothetical protein VK140_00825 [Ktedonobacteraceae bacterium]|nr:hypothetical protein [Ktedonobacteraceae bacterium]
MSKVIAIALLPTIGGRRGGGGADGRRGRLRRPRCSEPTVLGGTHNSANV